MSQSEREVLEKIAQVMENLPSESLLEKCWTDEQQEEWQKVRNTQVYIAECWRAKFIYQQGDPIAEALDKKEIIQHKYDLIWLSVNQYKAQWELIEVAEKDVIIAYYFCQKISQVADRLSGKISFRWYKFFPNSIFLKPYPFNSAYDLFVATLKEEVDNTFSFCLEKSHFSISFNKSRNGVKQLVKIIENANDDNDGIYAELNQVEQQKLKNNLGWHRFSFSWLGMTLFVCQFVARQNFSVRKKLVSFNSLLIESLKLAAKASRKLKGFTCIDGKKVPFDKFGGVPLKNGK